MKLTLKEKKREDDYEQLIDFRKSVFWFKVLRMNNKIKPKTTKKKDSNALKKIKTKLIYHHLTRYQTETYKSSSTNLVRLYEIPHLLR